MFSIAYVSEKIVIFGQFFEKLNCNFSIIPGKEVQKAVQGRRGEVGWRG
jgi:hypothetical protein